MHENLKRHERINDIHGKRAETNPVDDAANITEEEVKAAFISGVVTNCKKLNVRKEPRTDAGIIAIIPVSAEVVVDVDGSVGDFYKICTVAGIEGFCVKSYIALK